MLLESLKYKNGSYQTGPKRISFFARTFPTFGFYRHIFSIILKAASRAKHGKYNDEEWCRSSLAVLAALEDTGIRIEIAGVDNFVNVEGPCVFVSNHMSTLETFVLPVIIAPFKPVTFVVKKSLVEYPFFGHVMRSRDPITVGRTNPRKDLQAVMEQGTKKLAAGTSIIIFPQTTRYLDFEPRTFNTIGVKLAARANVPVVPIALKTDAWGNGSYLKDFGKVDPSRKVHFAFGQPLLIKDRGAQEHREIIEFIGSKLKQWTS